LRLQLLAVGVALVSLRPVLAVHLIRYQVSIDGKIVLETSTSEHGEDADTLWVYLKQLDLRPVKGYKVEPDREDLLQATLRGKVVIPGGGCRPCRSLSVEARAGKRERSLEAGPRRRRAHAPEPPQALRLRGVDKAELATGLQTRTGDTGDDPDNVWRDLKRLNIVPITRYKVEADRADPLQATLKGDVIIDLRYAGQSWGRAEVSELKLVRETPNARWKVAAEEVERTFRIRKK
jgi:hypothetical protein